MQGNLSALPADETSAEAAPSQLASFLAAKLCHDFASPAGAVINGLDMMRDPDNQDMRDYVAGLLRQHWRVEVAADGLTALDKVRELRPSLVLTDVMMPGLDGWGVAEALLEDERTAEIPIIFLTARAEFRDRARGLDIGGVDYITKPFNPVELAPLVRGLLDRLERGERDDLRREKLTELRALMAET